MPCYRCGVRQTDPVRGASPWQRAVMREQQVLICPDCQHTHDWSVELDRCHGCGSTILVCRLGEVECRACGAVRPTGRDRTPQPAAGGGPPGLSEEVAAALDRVLGGLARRA